MRFHFNRRAPEEPDKVVALCAGRRYVAAAMSSGLVKVFAARGLARVAVIDVGIRDIQTCAFQGDSLLVGSLAEGLVRADIDQMEVEREMESGVWAIAVSRGSLRSAGREQVAIIRATDHGGGEVLLGGKSVYRSRLHVLSLCFSRDGDVLAVALSNGSVAILQNGELKAELSLQPSASGGKPSDVLITSLCSVTPCVFAGASIAGDVFFFDWRLGATLQVLKVRDSSVNAVCAIGEKVFCIGADSRLCCIGTSASGRYLLEYQQDTHYTDVLCMAESEGRLITGGCDGLINIHWPGDGKFLFERRFPGAFCAGLEGGVLLTYAPNSLCLTRVTRSPQAAGEASEPGCIGRKPTLSYRDMLTLKTSSLIVRASLNRRGTVLAYSTRDDVRLFKVGGGTGALGDGCSIEKIHTIDRRSLVHLFAGDRFMVLPAGMDAEVENREPNRGKPTPSRNIQVYRVDEGGPAGAAASLCKKIPCPLDFIPSAAVYSENLDAVFVYGERGALVRLDTHKSARVSLPGQHIQAAVFHKATLVLAVKRQSAEYLNSVSLRTYSPQTGALSDDETVLNVQEVKGMCVVSDGLLVYTDKRIFKALVTNGGIEVVRDVVAGEVIEFMCGVGGEAFCLQAPWKSTRETLQPSVIKERYRNK